MTTINQTGLVYTNENCIGCNRCISVCPIITANHAIEMNDGSSRIEVDGSKCIACGACFDACEHHARAFRDDTERFFNDLEKGEKISVLWAPAFAANYPDEYERVLGGLKDKGVNKILSVSFGADITTWGYLKYITENNFYGGISQPCPAIVNYIEHFVPELIPKLVPVQSPVMCAAVYFRKYMKLSDKLAFISPCISKKREIDDPNNEGLVSYNVAFNHLMQYARVHNIFGEPVKNEMEYGLGSIYPMPGGLSENIKWFLGEDVFIRRIDGEKHAYHFLNDYKARVLENKELPFVVDALNCQSGCIYGTGVEESKTIFDDTLYDLMHVKTSNKKTNKSEAWTTTTPEERLKGLNEQFKDLDLKDFIRKYSDKSETCKIIEPADEEREEIFRSMKKISHEKQGVNCSACGYDTCRQMTTAIYNGCNRISNCVHYAKEIIQEDKEERSEVKNLLDELQNEAQISISRTHYMENLYSEIGNEIYSWTNKVSEALESGNHKDSEELLTGMETSGKEILNSIQDMLVSIRRTSRGLNLHEELYKPKAFICDSIKYIYDTDISLKGRLKLFINILPEELFGDKERIFQIIFALLSEVKQIGNETIVIKISCIPE
ncbi:MAG: 4Fe-4S dicluster domain-containing protein, partial [Treponema sp.]|nr:4Fe-4S dicluster domain-containing protein [Treponema sp.]